MSHHLDVGRFVTHHFTLDQFEAAYDVFALAADMGDPDGPHLTAGFQNRSR
jgi:hypothetical protein